MDFIGFKFNGQHSKDFGLYRVSDGSRYNEDLFANFQDTTTPIPGGDGLYYFRTNYSQKTFSISVAFDNISEEQFRAIRQWLNPKVIGPLIFDEVPYKAYSAKVQSPLQFKYICFDAEEPDTNTETTIIHNHMLDGFASQTYRGGRVYKGEGTIQFVCNFPYATSVYKYLNEYSDIEYPTKGDWAPGSKMKLNEDDLDWWDNGEYRVYNPGDVPADWTLMLPASVFASTGTRSFTIVDKNNVSLGQLDISGGFNDGSQALRINSRTNLIEGIYFDGVPDGLLYNKYILSGDFFKIPVSNSSTDIYTIQSSYTNTTNFNFEYNYLYF